MVALSRDAIARKDADIKAFAHVCAEPAISTEGPLAGVAIGIKDIFDTFDQPTSYGSPAYAGHRPERPTRPLSISPAGRAPPSSARR